MSPVLPIGTKGSGYSGNSWSNSWTTTIPFTGFYVFKGTVDNFADVTITQEPDSSEVTSRLLQKKLKRLMDSVLKRKTLQAIKFSLEKGEATINVNVRNGERIKYTSKLPKKYSTLKIG